MNKRNLCVILMLAILSSYILTGCKNSTDLSAESSAESSSVSSETSAFETQSYYYLGDHIKLSVHHQGTLGLCWAFAALNTLETNLALQGKDYDFSEMHMGIWHTGNADLCSDLNISGGDMETAVKYLFGNHGPVSEETVPYQSEAYSQNELEEMNKLSPIVKTNQLTIFSDKEVTDWKDKQEIIKSIKQYIPYQGSIAVQINISETMQNDNLQMALYTNKSMNENIECDHMVTIVGWDDSYSADSFPQEEKPEHDGAFIALNSWGDEWGENGLFYISYDDMLVYNDMSAVGVTTEHPKTVTGKFKDKYLYEALKHEAYYSIYKYNDDTLEIEFYNEVLSYITVLDLLNYPVTDLTGVDTLYALELIYANRNKIKDDSALYNLPDFDWEFWKM